MLRLITRHFSFVTLSESCASRIKQICKPHEYMRLMVDGGEGCGGFVYKFNVDSQILEGDYIIESEGAKLVVDKDSMNLIKGATIDYTDEMIKRVFTVKDNPQADMTCGCGTSFSPKLK